MNSCLLENSITQVYKINWTQNGGITDKDDQEMPRKDESGWVIMIHNDS